MKKVFLSVSVILAFGFYIAFTRNSDYATAITPTITADTKQSGASNAVVQTNGDTGAIVAQRPSSIEDESDNGNDEGSESPAPVTTSPASKPTSKPSPTPAPKPAPAPAPKPAGQYRDGSYTGSVVDAYYGYVEVRAVVQGGKLADVQFLQYPNDRGTSRAINGQAMPILTSEAVQAQSAQVDIVSGATATSDAFRQSLASALGQAKA